MFSRAPKTKETRGTTELDSPNCMCISELSWIHRHRYRTMSWSCLISTGLQLITSLNSLFLLSNEPEKFQIFVLFQFRFASLEILYFFLDDCCQQLKLVVPSSVVMKALILLQLLAGVLCSDERCEDGLGPGWVYAESMDHCVTLADGNFEKPWGKKKLAFQRA